MKILAVIPARGGSKRLPNKNLLKIGGDTLIQRSFESVKGIKEIQDILLSSDCPEIIEHGKNNSLLVPWKRPSILSGDKASSSDVVIHALNWYQLNVQKVDAVLLLQPTSPFRRQSSVEKAIQIMNESSCDSVISVSPTHSHPQWCFRYLGEYLEPFMNDFGINTRSQDLVPAYNLNGNFYLIKSKALLDSSSFYTSKTIPYVINSNIEAMDIDVAHDFDLAKYYFDKGLWIS